MTVERRDEGRYTSHSPSSITSKSTTQGEIVVENKLLNWWYHFHHARVAFGKPNQMRSYPPPFSSILGRTGIASALKRSPLLFLLLMLALPSYAQLPLVWNNASNCDKWVRYRYAADDTNTPPNPCLCTNPTTVTTFLPANTIVTGSVPAGNHICLTALYTDVGGVLSLPELCRAECVNIGGIASYSGYCYDVCGTCDVEISGYSLKVCP